MTDTLEERAPTKADRFVQQFLTPGCYQYRVLPPEGECLARRHPFVVRVLDAGPSSHRVRHRVLVRADAGMFVADPEVLTIAPGDIVLWRAAEPGVDPFIVAGEREFPTGQKRG